MSSQSDQVFEDPQSLQEQYLIIRDHLINDFENQYPSSYSPKKMANLSYLKTTELAYRMIGIDLEELERAEEEDAQQYQEYYYSEIDPKILEKAKIYAQQSISLNQNSKDSWIGEATPYSTLVLATDRKSLEGILPNANIHNPWVEKLAPDDFGIRIEDKEDNINLKGSGNGLKAFWLPEYLTTKSFEFAWVFVWQPNQEIRRARKFRWHLYFNNIKYGCHANDYWYNSKYASIALDMTMTLISVTPNALHTSKSESVIDYGSDNIREYGILHYMNWPKTLTMPAIISYEDMPVWIVAKVIAVGAVRGSNSHAKIDLSTRPFAIWCKGVEVIP